MSYIPKYILKRMLPKDCIKAIENGVEISFINVISPITIEEIPDNVEDYVELTMNEKTFSNEEKDKITITFEDEKLTLRDLKKFIGQTLPVGGKLIIFLPYQAKAGDEVNFKMVIKTDNPFTVDTSRVVQ